ncbi:MAG: hypothetical protein NTY09_07115 [bacterium]|nr:hypothetical protein [bacterium]
MTTIVSEKQKLKVLITVKTYPIPSEKYDELVCTAGVTEVGDFVRLYPINFRDLPFSQQYKKYQWIEVMAEKHKGRDVRKESYRPDCDSIQILGEPIQTKDNWAKRAQYALARKARSIEDLIEQQQVNKTSLGVFKPREINNLIVTPDDPEWKPNFKAALQQARLWETRTVSKEPPRKVPFKFHYLFICDDPQCKGNHKMMIEDWEVGALFWRLVDKGYSQTDAAKKVRDKFLNELCGPEKDSHFFVGTILTHPKSWVVLGVFWPKAQTVKKKDNSPGLFDMEGLN